MNMKKILKIIFGILLFLLIPGIFGGFGSVVYLAMIKPQNEAKIILKNGIEATATIIDFDSSVSISNTSGNMTTKERYYAIKLAFINSEGKEINYKSPCIYPEEFIRKNIEIGETIQVMYAGTRAVVKDFVPGYKIWLWLLPVIFGAIAVGLSILIAVSLLGSLNDYIVRNYGAHTTGKYLRQKCFLNKEESDLNSITCMIKTDNGDTIEVQTRFLFTNSEAKGLAEMESFPILYKGKNAVIVVDKNKK